MFQGSKSKQANTSEFYGEEQIREVLAVCGVDIGATLESDFLIFCPFHYNTNTPACEINKDNGLFFCFSCGERGNLLEFVMKTTNRNYFEAQRIISNAFKSQDFSRLIEKSIEVKEDLVAFDINTIERLNKSLLENQEAKEYYLSRGIELDAIKFFKLGYSEKRDMVTVPVYSDNGTCVGFVARSIKEKSFKNSVGLPRNKVLYNLNNVKFEKFAIVESSFDVIRLWQLNIPAVATLGANLGKAQVELIKKYSKGIIIAADTDEAGSKLKERLINSIDNISILSFPEGCKDIGDMTDVQIREQFSQLKSFDFALSL